MPVQRLNHAVLYVRDVDRSVAFYREALGFRVVRDAGPGGVPAGRGLHQRPRPRPVRHRRAGGRSTAGRSTVGLYHLAWEVDTLAELRRIAGVLTERGALVGASDHGTTKALYAHDPDGIEFEVSWLVPADLLTPDIDDADPPAGPRGRDRALRRRHPGRRRRLGRRPELTSAEPVVSRHDTLCARSSHSDSRQRRSRSRERSEEPR